MAISMVGAATVWRFLYAYRPEGQEQIGLQNAIVGLLGGKPVPWLQQDQFHLNSLLLMLMLLWAQIGFAMVLLSAAIKGVPVDTLEAARIDGAGERQIFFRVVVPQIKGTIITVFVTTLITVMKIFDIVYVMTNGNFNTNILGVEFYNQLFTNFNNGAAAAIVVILMVAMAPIMIYQVHNFRRRRQPDGHHNDHPRSRGLRERADQEGSGQARATAQGRPDRHDRPGHHLLRLGGADVRSVHHLLPQ